MDPNLIKIRDANRKFIQKGKLAVPVIHAKSYLFNILGEENRKQIEQELLEFINEIKVLAEQAKANSNRIKRKQHRLCN